MFISNYLRTQRFDNTPTVYMKITQTRGADGKVAIAPQKAEAFEILEGHVGLGLIVLCDHAENSFPAEYGTLGLATSELSRHIAYDIGAGAIARSISEQLGAPALLSRFSRLLIDPNRGEDDPTLIMRLSDGAIVPGNRHVDQAERDKRIKLFYRPYHMAIDSVIEACLASGIPPILLSIHSFTESWKGVPRPWHAGVLWDRDPRLAQPILDALYAENDLIVGNNQPYRGDLQGDTMWRHGTSRGLAHAILEIRQDLIRSKQGQQSWAERLTLMMRKILADDATTSQFRRIAIPPVE
ncbi:MAG: N-formylglutamate amidohydrolase [Hyphomicrobiaceae bacterium]